MSEPFSSETDSSVLSYTDHTRGLVPIPIWERDLPTAVAKPYFKVSDTATPLEGLAFDRSGNLLFVDIYNSRVHRLSQDRHLTTVYSEAELHPAGIAVHKDGRIFVAAVGRTNSEGHFADGTIISVEADGSNCQTVVQRSLGHVIDDMVFDNEGGFYFTDFRGTATNPIGGVYYVPPDHKSIHVVLPSMCGANGVALSPDGKVLWATEYFANRLHRMDLKAPGVIARCGSMVPYHFVGRAPDSMRTDSAGNTYVAMQRQGRILVFSPYGVPIGQILLPGREDNRFLQCTSLAIKPNSRELFIVGWDLNGQGSMIFSASGPAPGFAMFSHQ
ncbi:SMP-30/gluconolactonase/LRE family protein [Paraburkholderia domus]|uniref:Lactonase drp35 n=1 Tax=Paraburkholderia domus TaxID=2793075 RepID=A0A9N8NGH3_9BURK|nr:SMP-30/gluconolactonase/LRE family protein [Paraburkholderia domus]MBK5053772.1 SMP-30/gluconolactonase/LRE family protein [Burkholderia sp. R-70006]MBK5065578.1 SMP-30/gluconolactonase/LRE family protein [Burkholderia sp. R-70199]MBK5170074.1 SMP-30/gluconolactonase/LRE family protein [Burkholderia sp. R-70211]MBK5185218.1 SMP-30/gluconolactonase/LRE family protein [Burkholderia sp. R-69749]CAE6844547.1 Lactonase drp35 [Paraburkholderia domus]